MSYTFRFDMVEDVSTGLAAIGDGFNHAEDRGESLVDIVEKISPALDKVTGDAKGVEHAFDDAFDRRRVDQLEDGLDDAEDGMSDLRRETVRTEKEMGGLHTMGMNVRSVVGAIGLALAGFGLGQVVTDSILLQSQFEANEVVLGNTIGNIDLARAAMKEVTELAAVTPFGIEELQSNYLKLVNRGIKPVKDEIIALGDLAASKGKDFEVMTEALLDAAMGQFDRLANVGIGYETIGENVALTFTDGITKVVPKTKDAIVQAFIEAGQSDGIAGVMEAVSLSTAGILSGLADQWALTKVNIGESLRPLIVDLAPVAIKLMGELASKTAIFGAWILENKDQLVELATTGVSALGAMAKWIGLLLSLWAGYRIAVLGAAVAKGIWTAAIWVGNAAIGVATAASATHLFLTNGLARAMMFATAQQWLLNIAMSMNPIGIVVLAIAAAIGAIALLAYNFEGFRNFLYDWGMLLLKASPFYWLYRVVDYLFPNLTAAASTALSGVMDWFKDAWDYIYDNFVGPFVNFVKNFTDLSFDVKVNPNIDEDSVKDSLKTVSLDGEEPTPDGTTSPGGLAKFLAGSPGGGTASGVKSTDIGGLSGGGSGSGAKNISISITKLIENLNIHVADMKEGQAAIKKVVVQALFDATNEVNFTN